MTTNAPPFLDSLLTRDTIPTQAIAKNYPSPIYNMSGISIYSYISNILSEQKEEDVPSYILPKVFIQAKRYENRYQKEFENFKLSVFVHEDGALLIQQHNVVKAEDNELVLFLEINNKSNYFGSVMRIKVGRAIQNLDLPETEIIKYTNSLSVNIPQKDMEKLLNKSELKNKAKWLANLLLKLSHGAAVVQGFAFEKLGDFFLGTVSDFFENAKIKEHRWNPDVKEKAYDPYFTKGLQLKINQIQKVNGKHYDYDLRPFRHAVKDIFKNIDKTINQGTNYVNGFLPKGMRKRLNKVIAGIKSKLEGVEELLTDTNWILELLKLGFQTANAYFCGIINSIIDFIKGIFDLIGIVFQVVAALYKTLASPIEAFSLFLEMLENILEAIFEFDLLGFVKAVFLAPIKIVKGLFRAIQQIPSADLKDILATLPRIAYYCGYIIGFIVTLLIEALLTGGVKAVEDIIAKFTRVLKNPGKAVAETAESIAKKGKDFAASIIKKLSKFFEDLKSGKALKNLEQWVNDILASIKKELGLGDVAWMSKSFLRLGDDWATMSNASKLLKRADDGWFNVLCHGTPKQLEINGRVFKPEAFAKYLKELGHVEGKKVRLISCNTGRKQNGFAQKLANILKVEVEAPTDVVKVNDVGEFVVGKKEDGIMKIFKPQN